MTAADIIQLCGYVFSAWALGYGMGLLLLAFRKFTDKI